ncbi:MAG: patatin-like phospholipase family protein [bacterium]|nr:patatin-like phospholipase family protein [bacterium]
MILSFLLTTTSLAQEKVGVVLSGGGATGLAHIGVLKALEEKNIPIDYITGTSAGALVGSLYAAGYSPSEIEAIVVNENFEMMANGDLPSKDRFLLREEESHAGMVSLSFSKDSLLKRSLPTNFTSSAYLDFEMMRLLGSVSASHNKNFDELFVPFRCVASDIQMKSPVVFEDGDLNAAVRASMTYPFYFFPIRVDDILLFDGGLYNNFPADVMYTDFNPDFIIGSNVSYNADPPTEDDLIGQVTNMLVSHTKFELPCEQGIIIEPQTDVSSFAFDEKSAREAIQSGYDATIAYIDSIRIYVSKESNADSIQERRTAFRDEVIDLKISEVQSQFENKRVGFAQRTMIRPRKNEVLDQSQLEKRYYRLYAAPQIDFLYPTLSKNSDTTYKMSLNVHKARDFKLDIGGHISSRPVNTGYAGLTFQSIGKISTRTKVETYFGKFYGSAKAQSTVDLPAVFPTAITGYFVLNRWDYFRSFATFFEESKPSFLVQNEIYLGGNASIPVSNTIKATAGMRMFRLDDNYYQIEDFTSADTADITNFDGYSAYFKLTHNTLNRKQFASSGNFFNFEFRYVNGKERTLSGSTSILPFDIEGYHEWINMRLDFQSFIVDEPFFHFGVHGQLVSNSQTVFANYTASLLALTEFSLVPDAKTYFLPEYRSPQFAAVGANTVFTIKKVIDLRLDAYFYQPFTQLRVDADGKQELVSSLDNSTLMASASAIFHSFIGPIRFTTNYFPQQETPFSFQFSMGYVLFNERAIR